jgi:hypothetical protein
MNRLPTQFTAKEIRFLAEQDGPSERILKSNLCRFFESQSWAQAGYLVLADFGEGTAQTVALCVKGEPPDRSATVSHIQSIFSTIFNTSQHMDVLFLTEPSEKELSLICHPFFRPA